MESSYGIAAVCRAAGQAGVAEGMWNAYFRHQALPFPPLQQLWVKK
ncbi:hypothetical protein ACIQPT_09555 [Streptomyces sp. NPDC091289]